MKNAMQLKAIIKNIAKEKNISAQLVMQNYMMERLLERISLSSYQDHYILKGGFLIAAMVGLDTRATMDMDATIKGIPVSEQSVKNMFLEICKMKLQDDVVFSFLSISEIREGHEYGGYRVALSANFQPMAVPLKLDITSGDKITPRDFYDVYVLQKLQSHNIDIKILREAIVATSEKRNSHQIIKNYKNIIEIIRGSNAMNQRWKSYQKDYDYAKDIDYEDVCDAVLEIADKCIG